MTSERRPPSTRETLVEAWSLLRRFLPRCLVFGAVFQVVATLLLAPFVVWLADNALALDGASASLNFDIAASVLSPVGVVALFVWSLGTALLVLLGLGGQVVLASDAWRRGSRPLMRVWRTTLAASPRLARPAILRVAFCGIVVIPLLTLVIGTLKALAVGSEQNLVTTFMPGSFAGQLLFVGLLLAVALGCYALLIRWTFLLHALLLERRGLRAAMKRSAGIVGSARGSVLKTMVAFHLIVLVALAAGSGVFRLVAKFFFTVLAPEPTGLFVTLAAMLAVGTGLVATLVMSALAGYGAALATVLFHRLGGVIDPADAASQPSSAVFVSRRKAVWAIILVFAAGFALALPRIVGVIDEKTDYVGVTAHRGSSGTEGGAPENTMAAFRLAILEGTDFIELDVMEAGDGSLVVVHDVNLKRIAGVDRPVHGMTLAELQALDVGSHFDPKFASERIPTLKDVIDLVRGKAQLNIELKTHKHEQDFPASVVRLLEAEGFRDECVVTSLDASALEKVRALDPTIRIGAIVTVAIGDVHGLDVDFYSVNQKRATPAFIRRAHARDREVHAWTVNSEDALRLMMDRGVDNVITDYPARAVALRAARGTEDDLRGVLIRLFDR